MGTSAIVVTKTIKAGIDAGLNCVISDARTPDALKDIVGNLKDSSSGGWITNNYVKNPIILFNNLGDFPVGTMGSVRWKDGQLLGRLILAPENTSERHDEIRKLIQCGVLKGISCSFRPIESVKLKSGATHFLKMDLVSVSLMAFGCHPDALLQAKAAGVSTETIRMIFRSQNAPRTFTKEQRATINRRAKEKLNQVAVNPEKSTVVNKQLLESKIHKAEASLALAKSKPLNKAATISERMEREDLIEKHSKHLRTLRRALEVLTRTRPSEVTNKARDTTTKGEPQSRSEGVPQKDHPDQIIWRGQKIPIGWSYPCLRKNWWDPES